MTEREWLKHFTSNLHDMMREARLSQRDLADLSGLAESTISRYLSGRMMPSTKGILALKAAFNCTVEDLIDFGEPIV